MWNSSLGIQFTRKNASDVMSSVCLASQWCFLLLVMIGRWSHQSYVGFVLFADNLTKMFQMKSLFLICRTCLCTKSELFSFVVQLSLFWGFQFIWVSRCQLTFVLNLCFTKLLNISSHFPAYLISSCSFYSRSQLDEHFHVFRPPKCSTYPSTLQSVCSYELL